MATDPSADAVAEDDLAEPDAVAATPDSQPADDEPVPAEPAGEVADDAADDASVTSEPRVRVRPEQTKDDTDAGWGERHDESSHDRWLREQRPPHWE
jgi:hypothetical protein